MTLPEGAHIVAVTALVLREGRVLAMRRSAHRDAGAGLWETPSGRVREGEEPLDAVKRELAEEAGLDVAWESRPFAAYPALRGARPMIVIAFRAHWRSGEVVRSDEHDAHAWWTPDEWRRGSTLTRLVDVVTRALAEQA
jgi:8-oxo-dGTP diphosphatase